MTYAQRLGITPPRVEDVRPRSSLLARMVTAIVEHGAPMEESALAERLLQAGVAVRTGDMVHSMRKAWHGLPPIYREPDGRYGLDLNTDTARYMLHEAGFPTPRRPQASTAEAPAEREARERDEAARLQRAVLSTLSGPEQILAVGLADLRTRETHTWIGAELERLPESLARYDVIAAPDARQVLSALGLDADRWRLADLSPPQKTRRLNKAGRLLHITPPMILSATVGKTLGDPAKMAMYYRSGELTKLRRRLVADATALASLYAYGVLHGAVRLRWGFLEEALGVRWAQPGDLHAWTILDEAMKAGAEAEIVIGAAPGWEEPWGRARRVRVVSLSAGAWTFEQEGHVFEVDRYEVAAARRVEGPAG